MKEILLGLSGRPLNSPEESKGKASPRARAAPTCSTRQRSARSISPQCRPRCSGPDVLMQRLHSAKAQGERGGRWYQAWKHINARSKANINSSVGPPDLK